MGWLHVAQPVQAPLSAESVLCRQSGPAAPEDARSDGEGRGSTLTVTFSKVDTDDSSGSTATATLATAVNQLRVFVVDDNADAADMLAMLIDGLGHQASVETHPRKALERITRERPDVCLLDVGMPDIDGHALARAIRAALAEAPVLVAITGYSQPQDRSAALEAGFTEHFAKPVDSTKLAPVAVEPPAKFAVNALAQRRQVSVVTARDPMTAPGTIRRRTRSRPSAARDR